MFFAVCYEQHITKNQQLTITYLTTTISTKTNSTALSYLSVITNKNVEMIAVKSLGLQRQQNRHTDTKKLMDFF